MRNGKRHKNTILIYSLPFLLIVSGFSAWRLCDLLAPGGAGAGSPVALCLAAGAVFLLFWCAVIRVWFFPAASPRRLFLPGASAILFGLAGVLFTTPGGFSRLALELHAENVSSPRATWGSSGHGLAWQAQFSPVGERTGTGGEADFWRADIPLSALSGPITVSAEPGRGQGVRPSLKSAGFPALAGREGFEVEGRQVNRTLRVHPGRSRSLALWFNVAIPILENILLVLYSAALGAVAGSFLVRKISENSALNLSLLASVLAVGSLLGEIALRPLVPPPNNYYPWKPRLRITFHPDPRFIPGIDGDSRFICNSLGIRGDELPPGQGYRILALGGSTTECKYLDQKEAWPALTQAILSRECPEANVWVGNIGQSGRGSREHVMQMKYLSPQYPWLDAVILLAGLNDLCLRLQQGEDYDPRFLLSAGGEKAATRRAFLFLADRDPWRPYYLRSATWRLIAGILPGRRPHTAPAPPELIEDNVGGNYLRRRHARRKAPTRDTLPDLIPSLDEYERNLNRIADLARSHNLRLIMMTQPTIYRRDLSPPEINLLWVGAGPEGKYYYSPAALQDGIAAYNERLLKVCRKRNIEYIDLARTLPKNTTVFYDDAHFNESGARAVAEAVAGYLLRHPPFSRSAGKGG